MSKTDKDNDTRADLGRTWTNWKKFQPLWKIRNYFGENIALYFAWQGLLITFLWLPAVLGLAIFFYGVVLRIDSLSVDLLGVVKAAFNNKFNPVFSLLICLWGTIFIQMWRRKSRTLAYEWDSNNYEDSEPDRPEFIGTELILDPVSKEMIWTFPGSQRLKKFGCAILIVALMMCLVFLTIAGSIAFKVFMRTYYSCPSEDSDLTKIPACKPGHTDHPVMCLLTGTILPALMMAISVMLWGTQLQNDGAFGMGQQYQDTCPRGSCMSTLAFQVLLHMTTKPVVKFFNDIIIPWSFKYLRLAFELMKLKKASKKLANIQGKIEGVIGTSSPTEPPGSSTNSYIEKEWRKPVISNFALEEFTEKVIQFGYVVMFAAAFPLAPFIALVVHLVDLRVDATRLLWFNRRPIAFIASDIGMWEPILSFLNFCGVVTNGFLVASTSYADQQATDRSTRLYTMLAFEHILFFIMYVLNVVIPDTPSNIKLAMRREKYQVAKILEDGYIPSAASRVTTAVSKRLGLRKSSSSKHTPRKMSSVTNSSPRNEKWDRLQPLENGANDSESVFGD